MLICGAFFLSATTALPPLAGDAFSPVRSGASRVGDSSDAAAAGTGAGGDGGFAPLAAGALSATSVDRLITIDLK